MVVYQMAFETRKDADAALAALEDASHEGDIEGGFDIDLVHEDEEG